MIDQPQPSPILHTLNTLTLVIFLVKVLLLFNNMNLSKMMEITPGSDNIDGLVVEHMMTVASQANLTTGSINLKR